MNTLRTGAVLWQTFRRHNGLLWATSLTYTTLFAIVPLFAVALSLLKAFGVFDDLLLRVLPIVSVMLDPSQKVQILHYIEGFVNTIHAGALGTIGTLVFFLASIPLYLNAEQAVNALWGKTEHRPIWLRFALCWLLITLGPVAIVLALSSLTLLDRLLHEIPLMKSLIFVMALFIILVFFLIYKIVPNTVVKTKPAVIGALTGGLAWIIAYHFYLAYMSYATTSFNIYGSLGAIPIFLFWIYINWIILLVGVLITKFNQYPLCAHAAEDFSPTDHLLAAVELLKTLFAGLPAGSYFTEEILLSDLRYPPEVTAAVIERLRKLDIIVFKSDIILPMRASKDITLKMLVEIFLGRIEEDVYQRFALAAGSPLANIRLSDLN